MAYENLIEQGLVVRVHGKGHFTTGNQTKNAHMPLANKKIYFIAPALRTVFMQDILNGITDFCDEHTIDVSIKLTKSDVRKEAQYIHSALSSDTKGIILFPIDNERINEGLLKLSTQRYPLVIIDRYFTNINSSFISTDNYTAMREAVKFLHGKKHTHFLYLTSHDSLATSVSERLNGYLDGMKAYFKTSGKESVLTLHSFTFEKIYNGVRTYLQENPQTEVIITNGLQTATDAILAAANSLNLSIARNCNFVGGSFFGI
jgi:DNA-binding LacI/PurR family transcriptional regulator